MIELNRNELIEEAQNIMLLQKVSLFEALVYILENSDGFDEHDIIELLTEGEIQNIKTTAIYDFNYRVKIEDGDETNGSYDEIPF